MMTGYYLYFTVRYGGKEWYYESKGRTVGRYEYLPTKINYPERVVDLRLQTTPEILHAPANIHILLGNSQTTGSIDGCEIKKFHLMPYLTARPSAIASPQPAFQKAEHGKDKEQAGDCTMPVRHIRPRTMNHWKFLRRRGTAFMIQEDRDAVRHSRIVLHSLNETASNQPCSLCQMDLFLPPNRWNSGRKNS